MNPTFAIVVRSHGYFYEPTSSVQEFLFNAGVGNPLFLQLDLKASKGEQELQTATLNGELKKISQQGLNGYTSWSQYDSKGVGVKGECLSIGLGGPPAPECVDLGCFYSCPELPANRSD